MPIHEHFPGPCQKATHRPVIESLTGGQVDPGEPVRRPGGDNEPRLDKGLVNLDSLAALAALRRIGPHIRGAVRGHAHEIDDLPG